MCIENQSRKVKSLGARERCPEEEEQEEQEEHESFLNLVLRRRQKGSLITSSIVTVTIECPPIPTVANALQEARNTKVNSRVTYTCNPGYRLVGSPEIACGADGRWTPAPPTCQI
jgi:hypothetical protein